MKLFENKKKIKVISVILIALIIVTSIIPNYSMASAEDDDVDAGGTLFRPIFRLLAGVGDLAIKGLQGIFLGDGDIQLQNPR